MCIMSTWVTFLHLNYHLKSSMMLAVSNELLFLHKVMHYKFRSQPDLEVQFNKCDAFLPNTQPLKKTNKQTNTCVISRLSKIFVFFPERTECFARECKDVFFLLCTPWGVRCMEVANPRSFNFYLFIYLKCGFPRKQEVFSKASISLLTPCKPEGSRLRSSSQTLSNYERIPGRGRSSSSLWSHMWSCESSRPQDLMLDRWWRRIFLCAVLGLSEHPTKNMTKMWNAWFFIFMCGVWQRYENLLCLYTALLLVH